MVRSTQHIDAVLETLREAWTQHPELRLGQLLVIAVKPKMACTEVFHAEDEQLVNGLGGMLKAAAGGESAG
ncbi:MAG TPA: hypothetical protein VF646_11685 [Cytophagales bacterium]|jgi:uncharacterized protein YihD (DUF1040 family)